MTDLDRHCEREKDNNFTAAVYTVSNDRDVSNISELLESIGIVAQWGLLVWTCLIHLGS